MLTPDARPLLVVGAALIGGDGRVLVQQRPAGKHHGGLWEFPGGKVEPGETPEAALVRELAEELGIVVVEAALAPAGFSTAAGIVLLLYAVRIWKGRPIAREDATLDWIAPDKLDALPMPPADRPLIPAVCALF